MTEDRSYYENLIGGVEGLYEEDLAWQESHWDEQDDFLRSEFLGVSLVDADRWLGILQDAARGGRLPNDLAERLHRVEALVHEAEPRIRRLRERANERAA